MPKNGPKNRLRLRFLLPARLLAHRSDLEPIAKRPACSSNCTWNTTIIIIWALIQGVDMELILNKKVSQNWTIESFTAKMLSNQYQIKCSLTKA